MNIIISVTLLLISAWFDAKGFYHATQTWMTSGQPSLKQAFLALTFFVLGVSLYLISVRFLTLAGVSSSMVQTLLWFAATIVGVAVMSGDIHKWSGLQYAAVTAAAGGLGIMLALGEH